MAESSHQVPPTEPSQYHHFIPRLLLKNFAVFKNPGVITARTSNSKKRKAPDPKRLNVLNLESGKREQADVGHTFGFVDIYRDFDVAQPEQHDWERRLSRLESDAGEIIARIKRLYEAGKEEVQFTRHEKDLLRRFLFIMLYRNRSFMSRFDKSAEDYDEDDQEIMHAYMEDRGFQKPKDVWFSNIRAFLDVDLDCEWDVWYEEIHKRAYPPDARWFFKSMQMSFLAICTPQRIADEFILTQNAYSIFEGPNDPGAWTDYHVFAPISPQLLLVTRNALLPNGLDEDEEQRLILLEKMKSMHMNPSAAVSSLEDLPVAKARNNYSQVVDGRSVLLPTKIARHRHVFYFPFFKISTAHVQKINMIMLEEAAGTMAIIYKSPEALRRSLEHYLADDTPGFTVVYRDLPEVPHGFGLIFKRSHEIMMSRSPSTREPYLHLLEMFAKELGSHVAVRMDVKNTRGDPDLGNKVLNHVELYSKLGIIPFYVSRS